MDPNKNIIQEIIKAFFHVLIYIVRLIVGLALFIPYALLLLLCSLALRLTDGIWGWTSRKNKRTFSTFENEETNQQIKQEIIDRARERRQHFIERLENYIDFFFLYRA